MHRYNSVEYQLSTVFNRWNVMEHIFLPTGKDGVAYCLYEHYVFISADKHVYAYTMLPRYILIHMCIESETILLWWCLKQLKKCLKKIASPWHGGGGLDFEHLLDILHGFFQVSARSFDLSKQFLYVYEQKDTQIY